MTRGPSIESMNSGSANITVPLARYTPFQFCPLSFPSRTHSPRLHGLFVPHLHLSPGPLALSKHACTCPAFLQVFGPVLSKTGRAQLREGASSTPEHSTRLGTLPHVAYPNGGRERIVPHKFNNEVSHFGVTCRLIALTLTSLLARSIVPDDRYHSPRLIKIPVARLGLNFGTISVTEAYGEGRTACKHERRWSILSHNLRSTPSFR